MVFSTFLRSAQALGSCKAHEQRTFRLNVKHVQTAKSRAMRAHNNEAAAIILKIYIQYAFRNACRFVVVNAHQGNSAQYVLS